MENAKDISMAPLDFHYMPASEFMDKYDGITSELNVNMEYDDTVDVTTTYLAQMSSSPNKPSPFILTVTLGDSL